MEVGISYSLVFRNTRSKVFAIAGSFDLTLTSRLSTRAIENLVVEMYLGEGAGNVKCVVGSGSSGVGRGGFGNASGGFGNANGVLGRGLGEVSGGGSGSWGFDLKKRVCLEFLLEKGLFLIEISL